MQEFLTALSDSPFLLNALYASLLGAVACGTIGSYVTVRRLGYAAGAIAHCTLGGLAAARYFQQVHGVEWLTPLMGAVIAALLAAVLIHLVTLSSQVRVDTILSAIWATGVAIGILFIRFTPSYQEDLMTYLFGNISMVTSGDLRLMLILNLVILACVGVFYNVFLAISFDEEFARLRGVRTKGYHLLLLCLIALTVVLLVQAVGIVLVIALLTIPAATAGLFVGRLSMMMLVAVLLCATIMTSGLAMDYLFDIPAGAVIILISVGVYLISLGGKSLVRRLKRLF